MIYPRNFWYVAAWDWEVRRQEPMARTICGEPIAFFRGNDGRPFALEDRCVHRHMPLSRGKQVDGLVECAYHGLRYAADGSCVHAPVQGQIPREATVRAYPVVERNHWVWVWMGDPTFANEDDIEDFHWLDDPAWRAKGERLTVNGNYLLLVENLLDLSHLQFVHPTTLGTDKVAGAKVKAERTDNGVRVTRWMLDGVAPPFYQRAGGFGPDQAIDRWQIIDYTPPAFVRLDVGGARAGTGAPQGDRSQGITMRNLNAITPETDTTTHYFWAQAHDFKLDDPSITELLYRQVHTAFNEDLGVIEAQQKNLVAFGESLPPPIDFLQDAGGLQARRMVDDILAQEASGAGAKAAE